MGSRSNMSSLFDSPNFIRLLDSYSSDELEQLPPVIDLYKNPLRQKEREHLETVFARLPEGSYKREIQNRFLLPEPISAHLGAWYELMVYDWLDGLGKNPILQPSIPNSKSKPDFLVESDGLQIFIEVTVVQESRKDRDVGRRRGWWPAATATFETMRESLIKKMGQHPGIPPQSAYVMCLCLENRLIWPDEVRTCFLGSESVVLKSRELRPEYDGEIFEKHDDMLLVKHRNVSALLVARRSGASIDEGYELVFELIQNPYAFTPIPETEFGPLRRYIAISETETRKFVMKWV